MTEIGRKNREVLSMDSQVWSICLTPDQQTLFCGLSGGSIKIYRLSQNGKYSEKQTLVAHPDSIQNILQYNDVSNYEHLISGGDDLKIKIWRKYQNEDYASHQCLEGHKDLVNTLCVHSESRQLFSCSDDTKVIIWELD